MGISTEEWRVRIGSHAGNCGKIACKNVGGNALNLLDLLLALGVVAYILVIGCVELNPGPFPCTLCRVVPETIASSIYHQHFHARNKCFVYTCPACQFATSSFGSLKFHVSQLHREEYHQDPEAKEQLMCLYCCTGENTFQSTSLWELVQHFYKHHDGTEVQCPIEDCSRTFKKKKNLGSHLAQYHKNWRAEGCPKEAWKVLITDVHPINEEQSPSGDGDNENFMDTSSTEDLSIGGDIDLLDDELLIDHIGKFYLSLYAEKFLPQTTIQDICHSLTFLTDIVHARIKLKLSASLKKLNISEDDVNVLCHEVRSADLLYTCHHKNSPGPSLTSHYLRKNFFKIQYGFVEPREVNLDKENPDSNLKLQYVSIKQTLSVLLKDPSVQKEVDASFLRTQENEEKVSDYTDGALFQSEDHPPKEIRIFLYQDGINPVMNVLGSAKNKYKDINVYFTVANFKPHRRSKIFTKHLVLVVREAVFKEVGIERCFEELLTELKSLEADGIEYKGDTVKVAVQFVLGDNLGQHTLGGFIECFTSTYFCRFCDIKKLEFKADPAKTKPRRTKSNYDACVTRASLIGENYKGIKTDSIFNSLKYIHATSHLCCCTAHDLFEGPVSWDLSGIIKYFVKKKKWFDYKLLNARIKSFKFQGIDIANQPAFVNANGKKLGGHAVQNWTLLRYFYLIIGDKIQDFEDDAWILYLQLKNICEYYTAPSFHKSDPPYLKDVLLPAYFEQRTKVLDPKSYRWKPKYHFMAHGGEHLLNYGPLLGVWTLPYEQKHKLFKSVLRSTKNFINPEFSGAEREQMNFCYITSSTLFDDGFVEYKPKDFSLESFSGELLWYLSTLNIQGRWLDSISVTANDGLSYNKEDILLLSSIEPRIISIGILKVILSKDDELRFVFEKRKATFNSITGIYEIDCDSLPEYCALLANEMEYPVPHPTYRHRGKLVLSLKHKLWDATE